MEVVKVAAVELAHIAAKTHARGAVKEDVHTDVRV